MCFSTTEINTQNVVYNFKSYYMLQDDDKQGSGNNNGGSTSTQQNETHRDGSVTIVKTEN